MCGIFGLIDHHTAPAVLRRMLHVALASLSHRGPDGLGEWCHGTVAIGMRRLSIIDLDGGQQPFFSAANKVVAFQNGEIYNFKILRDELMALGYVFFSHSDTEVLAHGYAQWGITELLRRLDGMFAIAIFDTRTHELFLARDMYGEKPLFFSHAPGRFGYASSLISLAALPWVGKDLDAGAMLRYLRLGFVPGDKSICRAVHRVLPGTFLKVNAITLDVVCEHYASFPIEAPAPSSYSLEELDERLALAVRSRLLSDVPVGIFLSGGIDSSLVAHYAAANHPGIETFSIGFDDKHYDESVYAKAVAAHVGSGHHHFTFGKNDFLDLLPDVAANLDEPIGDPAALPVLLLSRHARRHVKVVLAGEGGDELFGGYFYYLQWLAAINTPAASLMGKGHATESGFPYMMPMDMAQQWLSCASSQENTFESTLREQLNRSPDRLRRARFCDIQTWLPDDLLVKLDRMTMAASLEGRAPYLAKALAPYLCLAPAACIRGNDVKMPLRRLAELHLPRMTWDRPKQGFVLPMQMWLKKWFAAWNGGNYCTTFKVEHIDNAAVSRWVTSVLASSKTSGWERPLFSLLLLYEWNRHFKNKIEQLEHRYIHCQ